MAVTRHQILHQVAWHRAAPSSIGGRAMITGLINLLATSFVFRLKHDDGERAGVVLFDTFHQFDEGPAIGLPGGFTERRDRINVFAVGPLRPEKAFAVLDHPT